MKLDQYLAHLGYGSRREVQALFSYARVTDHEGRVLSVRDTVAHDALRVDGMPLDPPPGSAVMFHKPEGLVCSTRDTGPLIYDLLPTRFRTRTPVMAPIGRLDRDTTGLLLLTDDGALNHRVTSPRTHLPKVYEAELAEPLRGDEVERFAAGTMVLAGEVDPLAPATCEVLGPQRARLTLTEGRYHQVRRMFAACGNRVTRLHRAALGALTLGDLPVGEWRLLTDAEVALLRR